MTSNIWWLMLAQFADFVTLSLLVLMLAQFNDSPHSAFVTVKFCFSMSQINIFIFRSHNGDVFKATVSRGSWEMKGNSTCQYPVISICGLCGCYLGNALMLISCCQLFPSALALVGGYSKKAWVGCVRQFFAFCRLCVCVCVSVSLSV